MAFTPPTFNLVADIYEVTSSTTKVLRLSSPCNLAMGRRPAYVWLGASSYSVFQGLTPALLLPALTDIRDQFQGGNDDIVECPQGSGRWYCVSGVEDVGKGFSNEYRVATMQKIGNYAPWAALGIPWWPVPMP